MPKKRVHVYYSGMVQGVGFRFTARRFARASGISGWIKNLPDTRVELVGEAEEAALKVFLENIKSSFLKDYIKDIDSVWSQPTGEFYDFNIKFY